MKLEHWIPEAVILCRNKITELRHGQRNDVSVIFEIAKLELKPGDILVARLRNASPADCEMIKERLSKYPILSGVEILVINGDRMDFEILSAERTNE